MASITKNKLTVVVVVAILAIMLLPSMIDSSSVTNSTTNATTNNTTIQSTTITTAITANTCSTNQFGYGINASGYLSCNQIAPYTTGSSTLSAASTTSTANFVTAGVKFTYKPSYSGVILFAYSVIVYNTVGIGGIDVALGFGTGSAPNANEIYNGTEICGIQAYNPYSTSVDLTATASCFGSGFSTSTTYWFDLVFLEKSAGTTANLADGVISIGEFV